MKKENIDPKGLDGLLAIVSKKLGVPPTQLKKELQEGKFDSAMAKMSPSDTAKFEQVIKNPKLAEKFMSSSQAQSVYDKLKK